MSSMDFRGIEEMIAKAHSLGISTEKIGNRAVRAAAKELAETMASNAPGPSNKKRNPHLPDGIKTSGVKNREGGKVVEVGPGREHFYAHFLEFGTSKMSPHPFIYTSVEESSDRVLRIMGDTLRDGISR